MNFQQYVTCSAILSLGMLVSDVHGEELRWKFKPGDTWEVVLHAETSSQSTLNVKTLRTKMETRVQTKWTIDKVENDVAHITQEIVSLSLTGTGVTGVGILYDSASEEKPIGAAKAIAQTVAPYLGAKVRCQMNARGEISQVEADAALLKQLDIDPEQAAETVSNQWALELLQQPLCLLPEKEVAAGDSWEQERKLNLPPGTFVQLQTFTLPKDDKDASPLPQNQVRIVSNAELKSLGAPEKSGLSEQSQQGELVFDREAGRLVRAQTTQKLTVASPFRDKQIVVKTQSVRRVEVTPK